jgi:hypothetical protein
VLHASLGPFPPEKVHATDSDGSLNLRRVLETVCDTHEVEERDGEAWVELTKRVASAMAGSADGEAAGARPEDPAAFGDGGGTAA